VKKVPDRYENCKLNFSPFPNSPESRVSVLGASSDFGGGDGEEGQWLVPGIVPQFQMGGGLQSR
jgi:hypothetical protein